MIALCVIVCVCVCVCVCQHPVYCVNVVGTQNAHNLISISTDGKMCSWSLDMLSQPQVAPTVQTQAHDACTLAHACFYC